MERSATIRLEVLTGGRQMLARCNCIVSLRVKHEFVFAPQYLELDGPKLKNKFNVKVGSQVWKGKYAVIQKNV